MTLLKCFFISNFNIINTDTFNIKCILLFLCSSFFYPFKKEKKSKKQNQHTMALQWSQWAWELHPNCPNTGPKDIQGSSLTEENLSCMSHRTNLLLTLSNSKGTSMYHQSSPMGYNQILLAIFCSLSTSCWFLRGFSTSLLPQTFSAAVFTPV